jgi:hypothetical protein
MSDTGDHSVFMVFDYTNFAMHQKIDLVNHESIQGGSPQMQFSLLRTLYEQYTWYEEDGTTEHKPIFVMDAEALGGVVIKKLLVLLKPKSYDIDKDIGLFELKRLMSTNRDYYESDIDGAIIEKCPDFGSIRSYYIDELNEQLGIYHVEDAKLTTDFAMTMMMGVSYIAKKYTHVGGKAVSLNPLAGYNAQVGRQSVNRRQNSNQTNFFKS